MSTALMETSYIHLDRYWCGRKTRWLKEGAWCVRCTCTTSVVTTGDDTYTGETGRFLKARFMDHRRPSSVNLLAVSKHIHIHHSISLDNVRILEVVPKWFERRMREAIQINNLTLNKDAGRYNLPGVWNNTPRALGRRGRTRSQDLQSGIVDSQCPQHNWYGLEVF